jgi:hypothetical protein
LPNLIGFRVVAVALEIDFFLNTGSAKDMMASANSFLKVEPSKEAPQIIESAREFANIRRDLCISAAVSL